MSVINITPFSNQLSLSGRFDRISMVFTALLAFFLFVSTLPAQIPQLEIWEIQGQSHSSPFMYERVHAPANIVTAIGPDYFAIQTPSDRSDGNTDTSDGIIVAITQEAGVQVGDLVSITGYVEEWEGLTRFSSIELTVEVEASGLPLPAPLLLTEDFPSDNHLPFPDLEKVEGMYISLDHAKVNGPTNDYGHTPLVAGNTRSFREAGILFPAPDGLPEWDGNPEVFYFNPDALGLPDNRNLNGGMEMSATGILYFKDDLYQFYPTQYNVHGQPAYRPVREKSPFEYTVGCINVLYFNSFENNYFTKLEKLSNYILDVLRAPDILALQEVGSLSNLQALANRIQNKDPEVDYEVFLLTGNGNSEINQGFMVKSHIQDVTVSQLGKNETLSLGGRLHDRPPLLLECSLPAVPPVPLNILNLHLRSLNGIEGGNAHFVKTKRNEQAISVAEMVQDRIETNLLVVGDFNAFQFSDGYVDVVNQISGQASLGAEFPVHPVVSPPLLNISTTLPQEEQYSYVFNGNAQILDHCLSTQLNHIYINGMEYARANADNIEAYEYQNSTVLRSSDHDGFVIFLEPEGESTAISPPPDTKSRIFVPNPFTTNSQILLHLSKPENVHLLLSDLSGKWLHSEKIMLHSGTNTLNLPPLNLGTGMYFLNIKGKHLHIAKPLFYFSEQ